METSDHHKKLGDLRKSLLSKPLLKYNDMENPTNVEANQNSMNGKKSSDPCRKWIIIIAIALILTLPFHYVPSKMMMFPKNCLTFSYTFITQDDINSIVARYNNASFTERQAINNEPIVRKLMEKGIIAEKDSENSNDE